MNVVSRPVKLTRMCWGVAGLVMIVFTTVAVALGGDGPASFRLADQIAMVVLGALLSCGALTLTRARVTADAAGVRVRNVAGERLFPWQVVRAVRMDDGASWASLDLQDDDTVALFAVQANDGEHASRAVQELRALLRASRQGEPPA